MGREYFLIRKEKDPKITVIWNYKLYLAFDSLKTAVKNKVSLDGVFEFKNSHNFPNAFIMKTWYY